MEKGVGNDEVKRVQHLQFREASIDYASQILNNDGSLLLVSPKTIDST